MPEAAADSEPIPDSEPQEVWQWQINCLGQDRYLNPNPMPQNFGLLIGIAADAEARLKASVSLPNYYKTRKDESRYHDMTTYEFSDPQQDTTPRSVIQRGAIRCVSRDLKLIRRWEGAPFLVEEKPNPYISDFQFHPIKPQDEFIKGERIL